MESGVEKWKNNLFAFGAGVLLSGGLVWKISENLHKQELAILERSAADTEKRLDHTQGLLRDAEQSVASVSALLKVRQATREQRSTLDALLRTVEGEIATKKEELVRVSRISNSDPQSDLYLYAESELASLQQQRADIRSQMIRLDASR